MSSFAVAIVGAGGIANAHINAAKSSGGAVTVAAVVDPVADNAAKIAAAAGSNPKTFGSIDELFGSGTKVDGVIVCTPPSVRVPIIEKALERGVAVLSEKPLAHNVADSRRLVEAAKRSKSFTGVAYCHRFAPAVVAMRNLTSAGKIGTLLRFENVFACDLPGHSDKWFSDKTKSGGGAFIDMGCHSLDLFHFLVGASRVAGAVYSHKWPGRTETAATVLVRNTTSRASTIPVGAAGSIISGWSETARFTLALVGTAGMLSYDYEKPLELVFKDLNGKAEVHAVETHDVRFTKQLLAFAAGARGGDSLGLATFAEGLLAAEAVEAADKHAQS